MTDKLGIDIAKKSFDVTLLDENGRKRYRKFDNNESGFKQLQNWLNKYQADRVHACMEATNTYWEALADFLFEQDHQVSVVNPMRIKGFALSQMQRNKTDKIDSQVIVTFCAQTNPKLWAPPSPQQRKLRSLVRHRAGLLKSRTQQLNRQHSCTDEDVYASLQHIIEQLDQQMAYIDQKIEALIEQDTQFQAQYLLLLSIKGFGPATAIKILAEFYDLADYDSAQAVAADAGVTPAKHSSGTSVRKRTKMSKVGKASVRGAMYWPAITAIQHNPIVKDLAKRLEARGKSNMVIIGAAMRKLLHIAYGVLKNNTPFDPAYTK